MRGSIATVSGCVSVSPPAVSLTAYFPGNTQGPRGSFGVFPGTAAIGYPASSTGGAGQCRSQTKRCSPAVPGGTRTGRIHQCGTFPSSPGAGASSRLEKLRTVLPDASRISTVTSAGAPSQ